MLQRPSQQTKLVISSPLMKILKHEPPPIAKAGEGTRIQWVMEVTRDLMKMEITRVTR